jgi:hypothetical protein
MIAGGKNAGGYWLILHKVVLIMRCCCLCFEWVWSYDRDCNRIRDLGLLSEGDTVVGVRIR